VHVFDVHSGQFLPASTAEHAGTGPYHPMPADAGTPPPMAPCPLPVDNGTGAR
jgi:hypothetical protein